MAGYAGGAAHGKFRNLAGTVQAVRSSEDITIFGFQVTNTSGATAFVQVFDVATAGGVTLGTTTPDLELQVPSGQTVAYSPPPIGISFLKGCQIASTTTESGNTGSAAGVQVFIQFT